MARGFQYRGREEREKELEKLREMPEKPPRRSLSSRIFGTTKSRLEKGAGEEEKGGMPFGKPQSQVLLERIGKPSGESDEELNAYGKRVSDFAKRAAALGIISRSEERGTGAGFSLRKFLRRNTRKLPDVMDPGTDWQAWLGSAAVRKAGKKANNEFTRLLTRYIDGYVDGLMGKRWYASPAQARAKSEKELLDRASGILFQANDQIGGELYSDWRGERIPAKREMTPQARKRFEEFMRRMSKR
ncbi:MAG: hypothetical protein V1787_05600 [Candidatus Micrarchaeota archaeon]